MDPLDQASASVDEAPQVESRPNCNCFTHLSGTGDCQQPDPLDYEYLLQTQQFFQAEEFGHDADLFTGNYTQMPPNLTNSPNASMPVVDPPISQSHSTASSSTPARSNRRVRSTQADTATRENSTSDRRHRPRGQPVPRDPRNPQVVEQRLGQGQVRRENVSGRRHDQMRAHRPARNGVSMNPISSQAQIEDLGTSAGRPTHTLVNNWQNEQNGFVMPQVSGQGLVNGGQHLPVQPNWPIQDDGLLMQQGQQQGLPNGGNQQFFQPDWQNQQNGLATQPMLNGQGLINGGYQQFTPINGQFQQNSYQGHQEQGAPGGHHGLNNSQPRVPVGVLGEPRCPNCGMPTTVLDGYDLFMCPCFALLPASQDVD